MVSIQHEHGVPSMKSPQTMSSSPRKAFERFLMKKHNQNRYKSVKGQPGLYRRKTKDGSETWGVKAYDRSLGKTVWVGTCDTRTDAKEMKRNFEIVAVAGSRLTSQLTVGEYAKTWPERHGERRKDSTLKTYKEGIRPFLERFGSSKIRRLDRYECVQWAAGENNWTVNPSRILLGDMMRDGLINTNPLSDLRRAQAPGRRDYPALSSAEVDLLLEKCFEQLDPVVAPEIAGVIASCAYLGVRKSEAFALSLDSVDVEGGIISVNSQIGQGRVLRDPKQGKRRIALTSQAETAWSRFGARTGSRPMFLLPSGKSFTPGSFDFHFSKVVTASGIKGLTLHELRHHHATWLLHLGVPEWAISVQLGHALRGLKVTNLYIHPEQEAVRLVRRKTAGNPLPLDGQGRSEFVPPTALNSSRLR